MNPLAHNIKKLLVPKDELNKKQVALFLTPTKIEELDKAVKTLSNYSNGKVNRNILIELAIDNLLDSIPEAIEEYEKENKEDEVPYDSVICPAKDGGQDFLIHNKRWEFVKLDAEKIKYLKHLVLYVGIPYSSIMYYADIKEFKPVIIDNQKKYQIYVENIKEINPSIPLGDISAVYTRSPKYTKLNKVLSAKSYSDIL